MVLQSKGKGSLKAQYALILCEAGGILPEAVLCILGLGKVKAPVVLVIMAVATEISPNLLDLSLSLAI